MSRPFGAVQSDPGLPEEADAVVIGAGIAGVSAAYFLARKGLSVALPEKVSRALDTLVSAASKMFALVVVAALGASVPVLVLTSGIIYTPGACRTAQSPAVGINAMDFVRVARARCENTWFIVREEILPNIIGPVLADFGLRFVFVVLSLDGLSFLDLGVLGEPGCGRSTLARVVAGLLPVARSEMLLRGEPLPPSVAERAPSRRSRT